MTDNDAASDRQFADDTLISRMGMSIVSATAERVEGTMPVEGNRQPYGLLHGGASAALAETLGSIAAMHHAGPDHIAVGIELSISHHRSATSGIVTGVAEAVHLGRTVATYAVRIEDETGRLLATSRLTCAIRSRPAT
ncbi:PaaI family thioesterase [Demequina sp. NBRC 110051]|uniref:PaaI family thioesterase n=1 Tax=Demequina sp. NBRC 110051 TaxID=1570340 RepID=UPI000A007101|nr:PaaI family thioesterase [Demequina sp. NBRC 110051]